MNSEQKNRLLSSMIGIIIILGFLLRIYKLGCKGIWFDEAVSISYVQEEWTHFLWRYFNYKPFYFILLKIWTSIFGISEFTTRFFSVVFATLSIYLIYEIGQRLFSKEIGLVSALLLALSCFHVYHSQQVRQLAFLAFLTLFSYLISVEIFFGKKAKRRLIILNAIINIFSMFTHPYGLALPFSQNVFFLTQRKYLLKLKKDWGFGQAITGLFLLLWLLLPHQESYIKEMIWWIPRWSPLLLFETLETFCFGGPRYGLDDFKIISGSLYIAGYVLACIYLSLFLTALARSWRKPTQFAEEKAKAVFLLVWLFVPILLAIILSFIKPVYVIKHFIYVLPAFYILVGLGWSKLKQNRIKAVVLLVIVIASIIPLKIMYTQDFNIDWRSPAIYIRDQMKDEDTIIIFNLAEIVPFMYYFDHHAGSLKEISIYGKNINEEWQSIFRLGHHCIIGIEGDRSHRNERMFKDFKIKVALNQYEWMDKNIWLASSRWAKPEVLCYVTKFFLRRHYKLKSCQSFRGIEVLYFSHDSDSGK